MKPTEDSIVGPQYPWLGLHPFTEDTLDYFYGREEEIEEIFERIAHKTLTILFGQSGLGKTSLIQAGLIPQLSRSGYVPVKIRFGFAEADSPLEQQVISKLRDALLHSQYERLAKSLPSEGFSLWQLFHEPEFGFIDCDGTTLVCSVLIFDQFEEIFTRVRRRADADAFSTLLADLVENRPPEAIRSRLDKDDELADRVIRQALPCKVLLSLRQDYLHALERWRSFMPSLMENRYELRCLTGPKALLAVYEPGTKREGKKPIVDWKMAEDIVRFVAKASANIPLSEIDGVPPLLSLICREMNQQRRRDGGDQLDQSILSRQSQDILKQFYSDCFKGKPARLKELVEDLLLSTDGADRDIEARDAVLQKLKESGVSELEAEDAIDDLVNSRLIVIEEWNDRPYLELTHDILTGVAKASRDQRREQEAKKEAELAYQARKDAEKREDEQRRQKKVAFMLAGIFTLLFLVAIGLLIWGWNTSTRLHEQLRQASWVNFNQANRLFQLGQWSDGMLHLALAVKNDPKNEVAAERFFHELMLHRAQATRSPMKVFKHPGDVLRVAFSPDGREILTVNSADNDNVKLWDAETGGLLHEFPSTAQVFGIAFSRGGGRILTASNDRTAKLWSAWSGDLLRTFKHAGPVLCAIFDPEHERVLTVSADNTAKLWDAGSGELIQTFRHERAVRQAAFSPNGQRILTASDDGTAKLWRPESEYPLASLEHQSAVSKAVFDRDGERILTVSESGAAYLWDVASPKQPISFQHAGKVSDAVFSPDGKMVLTGGDDNTAKLWDVSGKLLGSFQHAGKVCQVVFDSTAKKILTASVDNTAKLWDSDSLKLVGAFQHAGAVSAAIFSPDDNRILTASNDQTAKLWDATSVEQNAFIQYPKGVSQGVFDPNGRRFLTVGTDTTSLWDATSGKQIYSFPHTASVSKAVFSRKGDRILTISENNTAELWNGESLGLVKPLGNGEAIVDAEFDSDSKRILTVGRDNAAKLWNVDSGEKIREFPHNGPVWTAAFSRDGDEILTASSDKTARLWNKESKDAIKIFPHQSPVLLAIFDRDGKRILTGTEDGTAVLWNAQTGKELLRVRHQPYVNQLAFDPVRDRILTAGGGNTAKLWDADSSVLLASFEHDGVIRRAVFSSNGKFILTAGDDRAAKLWDAQYFKLLASFEETAEVTEAIFSPDNKRVLIVAGATTELRDVMTPEETFKELTSAGDSLFIINFLWTNGSLLKEYVQQLTKFVTGASLQEDGMPTPVTDENRRTIAKQMLSEVGSKLPNDIFFRWFFSSDKEVKVFPGSSFTPHEWKTNSTKEN